MSSPLVPVAVLASGSGSNLEALLAADLGPARVRLVVVNVAGAGAIARAERAGVEVALIEHRAFARREDFDRALRARLQAAGVEWVVLAGFLRILGPAVLDAFPQRVVNVHPSLLPAFPGLGAQAQALAAGVRLAGCTVHLVDAGVDTGPVLAQTAVPVLGDDDVEQLSRRILRAEHRLLPRVVRALAEGRLERRADGLVTLAGLDVDPALALSSLAREASPARTDGDGVDLDPRAAR